MWDLLLKFIGEQDSGKILGQGYHWLPWPPRFRRHDMFTTQILTSNNWIKDCQGSWPIFKDFLGLDFLHIQGLSKTFKDRGKNLSTYFQIVHWNTHSDTQTNKRSRRHVYSRFDFNNQIKDSQGSWPIFTNFLGLDFLHIQGLSKIFKDRGKNLNMHTARISKLYTETHTQTYWHT